MSIIELLINEQQETNLKRFRIVGYFFTCLFIMGYLFEVLLSEVPVAIFRMDISNIIVSSVILILFILRKIQLKTVFKVQIMLLLANMVISHYINPVDTSEFTRLFLRNSITMGMLVPIYGFFCGKRYIFQIGLVYLFLYLSTLIRVNDQFLIENAPFLILNSTIYFLAMYYILHILEKTRQRQNELTDDLILQKRELMARNKDLEQKNNVIRHQSGELKELNATKNKLFSVIAHDLRSPFNSILGFSELLCEDIKNKDLQHSERNASIINSTARQTLALLENMLDWTKIQLGQTVFKPKIIPLNPVVGSIIDLLQSSLTLKKITVNCKPVDGTEVYADPNMLQTILRNLIQNAIKFTPAGGKIEIDAVKRLNMVEITIDDNGIGMDEKVRKNLFSADSNYTTTGTANEKGSGLGLVLCKEFVKAHDGKIWVEPKSTGGSRFIFTLPDPRVTSSLL